MADPVNLHDMKSVFNSLVGKTIKKLILSGVI